MNLRGVVDPSSVDIDGKVALVDDVEEVLSANSTLESADACGDVVLSVMACCQSLIRPNNGCGVLGKS